MEPVGMWGLVALGVTSISLSLFMMRLEARQRRAQIYGGDVRVVRDSKNLGRDVPAIEKEEIQR